jgi:hypothetical protein
MSSPFLPKPNRSPNKVHKSSNSCYSYFSYFSRLNSNQESHIRVLTQPRCKVYYTIDGKQFSAEGISDYYYKILVGEEKSPLISLNKKSVLTKCKVKPNKLKSTRRTFLKENLASSLGIKLCDFKELSDSKEIMNSDIYWVENSIEIDLDKSHPIISYLFTLFTQESNKFTDIYFSEVNVENVKDFEFKSHTRTLLSLLIHSLGNNKESGDYSFNAYNLEFYLKSAQSKFKSPEELRTFYDSSNIYINSLSLEECLDQLGLNQIDKVQFFIHSDCDQPVV